MTTDNREGRKIKTTYPGRFDSFQIVLPWAKDVENMTKSDWI